MVQQCRESWLPAHSFGQNHPSPIDRAGTVASSLSFVGFVQRSPGHLIQALHKQPSHDVKSKNGQPMDRGTYHRARGLFGFGYRAIIHRSGRPNGAQGDSPGQSEAPPWVHCALVSIAVGD